MPAERVGREVTKMGMSERLNPAVNSLRRSAIREFSKLAGETPGCIRLTLGEPDYDTPAEIRAAAAVALDDGETHYIENNGAMELRRRIAEFERDVNGLDYGPEEIIVTAGATEALFVSLLGILDEGDEVIIPTPAFVLYEQIVSLCRGRYVPMDTTGSGFQIRREDIEPLITDRTKAIVLNSPNNPTGCVYDADSLAAVRDAVTGRDIFVICDDVYRQLYYGREYHSFAEFSELREQLLVVQSFSKPYAMTGWRMGYLMADRSVAERLELVHQFDVVSTPAPFQKACISALGTDPGYMREEYRWRRDYVLGRLREIGMEVTVPEGAFYVFPEIKAYGLDSAEFCRRLISEAGVAVTPGFAFGSDDHIRISYCCSREDLAEGMNRLEEFVNGQGY